MTQPPRSTLALVFPVVLLMACGDGFNGHWVGTYNGTFTYADRLEARAST